MEEASNVLPSPTVMVSARGDRKEEEKKKSLRFLLRCFSFVRGARSLRHTGREQQRTVHYYGY